MTKVSKCCSAELSDKDYKYSLEIDRVYTCPVCQKVCATEDIPDSKILGEVVQPEKLNVIPKM